MNISKELLEKAKQAKTAEELLAMAKAENIELNAEEAAQAFAKMNKNGELSDEELDNVSGGCGRDCEPSGDTPKYHVGDRLMMLHPVIGRHVSVIVTYVSSSKSKIWRASTCLLTAPRPHAIKTGSRMCPNLSWVYGIHEMISIKE